MDPELFLLKMSDTDECQQILYKFLTIQECMGFYYSGKSHVDPFMVPFAHAIEDHLLKGTVDIDDLLMYMLEQPNSSWVLYAATTKFTPKDGMDSLEFMSTIMREKRLTPYTGKVDMDVFTLIVASFIIDSICTHRLDISEIINGEVFAYATNQYKLTKVNGAIFKKDGLIFDHKGYYYNVFTNKQLLSSMDSIPGFIKIIQEETTNFDFLYRLDERLSMPEEEYFDYTGVPFGKFYGPQFRFECGALCNPKTIIVHMDDITQDKLLMVVKKSVDKDGREFWHIEIETLPHKDSAVNNVITTFLHGMYYPDRNVFTHIDYTKNQYGGKEYLEKYTENQNGLPIDQYTLCRDLHYKIWCIENGEFSIDTWYKLMIVSLPDHYQTLLNEMLK